MKKFSLKTSYSENLRFFCNENELELILYNPINDNFYNSEKNLISELRLTRLSKICGEKLQIFKFEEENEFLGKKRMFERCIESEILLKDISNENINKDTFYLKMNDLLNEIKKLLKLNKLNFLGKKI